MHCRNCDYPLWNITARQCPECGEPFRPSQFEFTPQRVQFCCPHCETAYYGTDEKGHLEPRTFDCVGCGARISMDETVLRPAPGAGEAQTHPGEMPWIERRRRGRIRALLKTIGLALANPDKLMRGVPRGASTGEAIVFGTVMIALTALLTGLAPWLVHWIYADIFWITEPWEMFAFGVIALFMLLGVIGVLPVWAALTHLALRVTGGCRHGMDRTVQAMCYASGASVVTFIPCLGWVLGWIWWLVSAAIMVRRAQGVSGARAAVAVIYAPFLMFALLVGGLIFTGFWAGSYGAGQGYPYAQPGDSTYSTFMVAQALNQHLWQSNGTGPRHAIELCIDGPSALGGWSGRAAISPFCGPGSNTTGQTIPVGEMSLEEFFKLPKTERLTAVIETLEGLPEDILAHRFGDYVFVHHTGAAVISDPQLWLLVMLPDPAVNGPPAPGDAVHIALGDFTVTEITCDELAAELEAQNDYRATIELPPLPDPATVTHEKPARAPSPEEEESRADR